jgi:hypothetical protein
MTSSKLPRLELTEDPNKKNDFIIFRHQIKGKKMAGLSKSKNAPKLSSKKKRKHSKVKTRKHKKKQSIFNIF